jgi:glutamate/tyrosine decarboxylase-like PLP-dependent enzyme
MTQRRPRDRFSTESEALASLEGVVKAFLERKSNRPAVPSRVPDIAAALPPGPAASLSSAAGAFLSDIEPYLSASNGPRYLGFVTGGATPAALLGDWIAALYDQNVVIGTDSIGAKVEKAVAEMVLDLFGLSSQFKGTFVSGATMSNFCALSSMRQWISEWHGADSARTGWNPALPHKVFAGSVHSSIHKSMAMNGMGYENLEKLAILPGTETADLGRLRGFLRDNPDIPVGYVASCGTVNLVDADDFGELAALKASHPNLWLHTDAAFGLFLRLLDGEPRFEGIDASDSITIDFHKWLNVPYDNAIFFTRHRELQSRVFRNIAPYLSAPSIGDLDFLHLAPENSRRFRALPVWFSLTAYGRSGVAEMVRTCVDSANQLALLLAELPKVHIWNREVRNVVCFSIRAFEGGDPDDDSTLSLLQGLVRSGVAFMTPGAMGGRKTIRAAFTNWNTTREDSRMIADTIRNLLAAPE